MFLRNNWPGILWFVIIILATTLPGSYVPHVLSFREWLSPDKIIHLLLFAVFVYLWMTGLSKQFKNAFNRYYIPAAVLILGIIFGIFTELVQHHLIPGRHGSIYDGIANVTGCLTGWGIYYSPNIKFKQKLES